MAATTTSPPSSIEATPALSSIRRNLVLAVMCFAVLMTHPRSTEVLEDELDARDEAAVEGSREPLSVP